MSKGETMNENRIETVADLKDEIVKRSKFGNEQDPYLTAFIKKYGKCGEIYDEEEWLMKCGIFVRGWNCGRQQERAWWKKRVIQ